MAVRSRSASIRLISSLLTSPWLPAVFYQCSDFNRDLSRWDVSSVTNMRGGAVASPLPLLVSTLPLLDAGRLSRSVLRSLLLQFGPVELGRQLSHHHGLQCVSAPSLHLAC